MWKPSLSERLEDWEVRWAPSAARASLNILNGPVDIHLKKNCFKIMSFRVLHSFHWMCWLFKGKRLICTGPVDSGVFTLSLKSRCVQIFKFFMLLLFIS